MKHAFSFLAAAALLAAPALAAPDAGALDLHRAGDYDAAADAGATAGGAENLALAARALNARAYLETDKEKARKAARRAFKFAEEAVAVDPRLIEGHLQGAIALAQRGARLPAWKAFVLGLAQRSRVRLDAALALEPENPWTLSASGAWRLEVVRRGGGSVYGADADIGYSEFIAARAAAPDNIPIAYECALRLLAQDREAWRADALAALDAALSHPPQNAFERDVQAQAHAFQGAIAQGRAAERAFINAQP